jgi:hypothetical protein
VGSPLRPAAIGAALSVAAAASASGQVPGEPPFTERVEVHRVLVDVRVTDGLGQPLVDLTRADFAVRIGGKPARVESATWATGALRGGEPRPAPAETPGGAAAASIEGRLVLFLVQKDLEPSRIVGLMRLLADARPFFTAFTPRDRVAVVSFGEPSTVVPGAGPSLVAALEPRQADRAATMEAALTLLGRALEPLPGAKSVIVVGHGFGRLGSSGVTLAPDYEAARQSLRAARASVFCLDVTQADYHSLEAGLQQVADDTGGFFERTHLFPARALDRLAGVLAGHYVLMVERPPLRKGRHRVVVSVPRRGATVLVRDIVD